MSSRGKYLFLLPIRKSLKHQDIFHLISATGPYLQESDMDPHNKNNNNNSRGALPDFYRLKETVSKNRVG